MVKKKKLGQKIRAKDQSSGLWGWGRNVIRGETCSAMFPVFRAAKGTLRLSSSLRPCLREERTIHHSRFTIHAVAVVCLFLAIWEVRAGVVGQAEQGFDLRDRGGHVALPPLAEVEYRNPSGRTWAVTGRVPGEVETAVNDFQLCLSGQGWTWHTVTAIERVDMKMTLVSLRQGGRRLLLMIWAGGPGWSGFSLGEDYETETKTQQTGHGL